MFLVPGTGSPILPVAVPNARMTAIREEPAPARATGWGERCRAPAICVALVAITFAVFGQTLTHGFVNFDDDLYVYDNQMITGGLTLKGIAWAFTHVYTCNWHPLTWISLMFDCQFYGLHPWGYHLTNVCLHAATVILLFLVLREMTGTWWRSAFVAAVFAIHPLRVESVAWVAERKDVLSGLFFMLTLAAYVRYARGPRCLGAYGWVAVLFALGLLCKPMLVTLPLVLLLLDYWPLQRAEPIGKLLLEKLPLLALSAASCVATLFAQSEALHLTHMLTMASRLSNALASCAVYLRQMAWPAGLAVLYPYPEAGLPPWVIICSGLLLASLSTVALWQRTKRPWLLMGWLWYLVMLLPVLGIVQVGGQAHADRYTYLPQIGIGIAVAWLAAEWSAKLHLGRTAVAAFAMVVVAVLAVSAWQQTTFWKNSETLWVNTLKLTENNDIAHYNLGCALTEDGRTDEAIHQYQLALKIKNSASAHSSLAGALMKQGKVDDALTQFMYALAIDPKNSEVHAAFGRALLRKGNKEKEAAAHFIRSIQLKPDYARGHFDWATFLLSQGKFDDALAQYQEAVRIDPDDGEFHSGLGKALLHQGRTVEAAAQFQQALQIDSSNAPAQYDFANILLQNNHVDEAIIHYQKAVQIDPGYSQAEANLGAALLQKGDIDSAISHFRRALEIDPSNMAARVNLNNVLPGRQPLHH